MMRRILARSFLAAGLLAGAAALGVAAGGDGPPAVAGEHTVEPPLGLPPIFWPEENPYSSEKAELGRLLYFDNRLSSDNSVSCASCHAPEKAFTDRQPVSTGISGQKGGRSAPMVINRAYTLLQFWD